MGDNQQGNASMILRSSPLSPFGRKVKIAADVIGMSDRIEVVKADTADATDPLRQQNPLGKIPILITDDGESYYDSRVIIDYLDHLSGGRLIPAGEARFPVLRMQALADGLMDACILLVYENRWRDPSKHEQRWIEHQQGKVARTLAYLESTADSFIGKVDGGTIALACALGYMDLRFDGAWRNDHPRLVTFIEKFAAAVPMFEKTRPVA
jgi:glutathione S-transferase